MRARRHIAIGALVALCGLVVVPIGIASATPTTKPLASSPVRSAQTTTLTSTTFAGYAVQTQGLASASVTFTVPAATCPTNGNLDSLFEGVDTGSTFATGVRAGVQLSCSPGGTSLEALVATPNGTTGTTGVSPGDTVVASMYQSTFGTGAELHDLSNGRYWHAVDGTYLGAQQLNIGSLSQSEEPPIFTKVVYTDATVNGDDIGFASVGALGYSEVVNGVTVMKTGPLSTTAMGSSFTVKFKAT